MLEIQMRYLELTQNFSIAKICHFLHLLLSKKAVNYLLFASFIYFILTKVMDMTLIQQKVLT